MNISIIKGATIALAVLCTFAAPVIAEPLTSNQLRSLHSTDLTECAKFWFQGSRVEYCDYVRADGTIVGMRQNKERYYATYEIRDDGCFYYRSTDGGVWDGCYYYEHKSDNVYTLTAPNRFKYDVTFVEGDTENLK